MKRFLILIILVSLVSCGKVVAYKLIPNYGARAPRTIAVLPIQSKNKEIKNDVRNLLRMTVARKLHEKNYTVLSINEIDRRYLKYGSEKIFQMTPLELAKLMRADAVLYTSITKWDERTLATYAALKVGMSFKLYAKDGTRLWRAAYDTKEADIRFDRKQVEYAVLKAYEPRIERLVDTAFLALPGTEKLNEKKEFFKWLP